MDTRGKLTSVAVTLCCGYLILATWSPFEGYVVVDEHAWNLVNFGKAETRTASW